MCSHIACKVIIQNQSKVIYHPGLFNQGYYQRALKVILSSNNFISSETTNVIYLYITVLVIQSYKERLYHSDWYIKTSRLARNTK